MAVPLAFPGVASTSHSPDGEARVSGEVAHALLERVTQRIFHAGLMLQVALNGGSARDIQSAIDQLDVALDDVRRTVLTWTVPLTRGPAEQSTRAVRADVAHLSIAADFLSQAIASEVSRNDGDRWFAVNQAEHAIYVALLELLDN